MAKKPIPSHPAALYFNELAPGRGELCGFFGHFYHLPEPDALLTRPVAMVPGNRWVVVNNTDVNEIIAAGVAYEEDGKKLLLGVFRFGPSYLYQGLQCTTIEAPPHRGFLSGARRIGKHVYACGSQNRVYRLVGTQWEDVAGPLRVAYGGPSDPVLNCMDGSSESDMIAVGYGGAIVHFDGDSWKGIDSPTNQNLHQVLCGSNGVVHVCGSAGIVLRGTGASWEDISLVGQDEDFWGLAQFRSQVYCCTYRKLFRVQGSTLVEEHVPGNSAGTFYRLAANDEYLWATTGTGSVMRFDGRAWVEFVWPDSTSG